MKIVRVKLSPEAEEVYKHLNEEAPTSKMERMILKAVNQKVELIKTNQRITTGSAHVTITNRMTFKQEAFL